MFPTPRLGRRLIRIYFDFFFFFFFFFLLAFVLGCWLGLIFVIGLIIFL